MNDDPQNKQQNQRDDQGGNPDGKSSDDKNRQQDGNKEDKPDPAKRKRMLFIFAVVLVIAAIGGLIFYLHSRDYESTDDAQVDGHIDPVGARIEGTVVHVYVEDNTSVKLGDPLVDLDPRDQQSSVDQQKAQVSQAGAQLAAEVPNVPVTTAQNAGNAETAAADVAKAKAAVASAQKKRDQAEAELFQSQAESDRSQADAARYRLLFTKQEVSAMDYDKYQQIAKSDAATVLSKAAALESTARDIDQRRSEVARAEAQLKQDRSTSKGLVQVKRANVESQRANLKSTEAQLADAVLKLSYTRITSPAGGIVMRRSAEAGSRVSAGQQLMQVIDMSNIWITANFKETQLRFLHPGDRATVHVDTLSGDFNATVDTVGGSTGALASVLPPENATGNYVKVVQRIPVRLKLDADQDGLQRLRPGMSVEVKTRIDR